MEWQTALATGDREPAKLRVFVFDFFFVVCYVFALEFVPTRLTLRTNDMHTEK